MSNHSEYDIRKTSVPPLVHDATHPDESLDDDGADGALVAISGPPIDGGVPTYDSGTGKHTSQPGAGGFVPTYIGPSETFTVPANKQALYAMPIENDGTLVVDGFLVEVGGAFSGGRLRRTTTQSVSDNTVTPIDFDTEDFDTDGYHAGGTPARLTVPVDGYYEFGGAMGYAANAAGARLTFISLNGGSSVVGGFLLTDATTSGSTITGHTAFTGPILLDAGDYMTLNAYQSSGGSLNIEADTASFWCRKVD